MFEIDKQLIIDTDIPLIERDFHDILYMDEPLLFYGLNSYNGRIIGSLVEVNHDSHVKRFFHSLIDDATFDNYLDRQITYREILKKSHNIFVIDFHSDQTKTTVYKIHINDVPEDYLPSEDSYCPEVQPEYTFEYSLRLKGQLADKNSARPKTISIIQNAFADILESTIRSLRPSFTPHTVITPYQPSSFKLHFLLEHNGQLPMYGFENYKSYLLAHLTYILNQINKDLCEAVDTETLDSYTFNNLLDLFKDLYAQKMEPENQDYKNILISHIKNNLDNLSEIAESVGSGFDYITVSSVSSENQESPIGKIDITKSDEIRSSIDTIDQLTSNVQVDETPQRYDLIIYHLNTDSRKGNAQIQDTKESITFSRPSIKIMGSEPLEGTKYTESLHLNKLINILGKSKKVNGKYRHIDIIYE